ncbi:MAG: hypothetical protein J6S85_01750 [Methanobrevibacter sp.]|nr:hypothetical protein [Methanobrevibacter sp.]MBO7712259.1 hypothetical protein [Methanobrevibacter sp.]
MNIDRKLVARAFSKAGEEPITESEWEEGNSSRVRVVKDFYLATIQEALSSYDWTSQKKRAKLELLYKEVEEPKEQELYKYYIYEGNDNYVKAEEWNATETYYVVNNDNNYTKYAFMYLLPADCAKVVSVNDGADYEIEGAYIYTNEIDATLLYIQNYFTGKYEYEEVENPEEENIDNYYIKNGTLYEKATAFSIEETYYTIIEQDYFFYGDIKLDPQLSAYIECLLAARIALKLTGDMNKYQMLYNEAAIIGNNAQKKSAEMARNRSKGNTTWIKQLGLE